MALEASTLFVRSFKDVAPISKPLSPQPMFERFRTWLKSRHQKQVAISRALHEFRERCGDTAMGAHVLHVDQREAIVRVMYMTDHIPPNRSWYAVPLGEGSVRELAFEEVARFETPWR